MVFDAIRLAAYLRHGNVMAILIVMILWTKSIVTIAFKINSIVAMASVLIELIFAMVFLIVLIVEMKDSAVSENENKSNQDFKGLRSSIFFFIIV